MSILDELMSDLPTDTGGIVEIPTSDDTPLRQSATDTLVPDSKKALQDEMDLALGKAANNIGSAVQDIQVTRDLIQHIDEQASVCQEDIKLIEATKPGLLGERCILAQFTYDRTTAFLPEVRQYLSTKIAQESMEVQTMSDLFLTDSINKIQAVIDDGRYRTLTTSGLHEFSRMYDALRHVYQTTADGVIPSNDGDFINVLTTPIAEMGERAGRVPTSDLDSVLEDLVLLAYMDIVLGDKDVETGFSAYENLSIGLSKYNITVTQILDVLYADHNDRMDQLDQMLVSARDSLIDIKSRAPADYMGYEQYLAQHYDAITIAARRVDFVCSAYKGLFLLHGGTSKTAAALTELLVR